MNSGEKRLYKLLYKKFKEHALENDLPLTPTEYYKFVHNFFLGVEEEVKELEKVYNGTKH